MAPKETKAHKQQQEASSQPITQIPRPTLLGNQEYVREPPLHEEKTRSYASQVLIPLTNSGETHAFMCPIPDPNAYVNLISDFFLVNHKTMPLASKKKLDDKGKFETVVQSKP